MNYFNETHAVWEPLIERVDDGRRRWNLKLEVDESSSNHTDEGSTVVNCHSLSECQYRCQQYRSLSDLA